MSSNPSNQPERNMTDDARALPKIITILREPGAAERFLLGLLGPDDTRITQSYDDGDLRQNLAYHALAACLHFALWLRENGDSSSAPCKERDTRARISELEERVRNFEETAAKEAENEILRHQEQEALHQGRATHLDEVLRQLQEANADIAKLTQSRDKAKAQVEELTSALTQTRQLCEQAEVGVKSFLRTEKTPPPGAKSTTSYSLQQHPSPRQNAVSGNSMNLGSQVTASVAPYVGVVSGKDHGGS
ncbi:hypothetical protein ACFX13_003884 [Malus domestica]